MAVKNSLWFEYNKIRSTDFGILNVNITEGLQEEPFLSPIEILEIETRRDKPYFQRIKRNPRTLELTCAFEEAWDERKIREVRRWLAQDYPKPLWFEADPYRIYYAVLVDEPKLIHNTINEGYVQLNFRCDSPYAYSPQKLSGVYNLSQNSPSGTIIEFDNQGDLTLKPEISVDKVGNGNVSIVNMTNNNQTLEMFNLLNNESIYIDCENEHIESSVPGAYPLDQHNGTFLEMVYGKNQLKIIGDCKLEFRYRYIYL